MNPVTSMWFRGAVIALMQVTALQSAALRAQDNGAVAASAAQSQAFEQATREFRAHRYAAAYGRFARLPSACIALLMVRDGRVLFRGDGYATPDRLRRWSAMTVQAARQPPVLVSDNGKGFDPQRMHQGKGVSGMEKRARGIGAKLNIEGGGGTTVRLRLPLAPAAAPGNHYSPVKPPPVS